MFKNSNVLDVKNAFLNAALDCIVMVDRDNLIVEFNPSAEKTFGYSRVDVIGKDLSNLIIPERYREMHRAGLKRFVETGKSMIMDQRLELTAIRRDGSEFPIELTVTLLQQDPILFTAFIRDITDRKQVEESLKQNQAELQERVFQQSLKLAKSEERFRLMVEAVKDYAILMLDSNGIVITWNEGAKRLKGYTATEIIGQHFSKFYSEVDNIAEKPQMELREAALLGRFEDEGWRLRKDGTYFWANVVISAIRNSANELIGFSKVTRDLSDRKNHEDDLRSMRDSLAVQVKDQTKKIAQSRDQLDIILKGIRDGIIVVDESGRTVFANQAGASMFGFNSVERFLEADPVEVLKNYEMRDEKGNIFPVDRMPERLALMGFDNPPETIIRFRNKKVRDESWSLVKSNPIFDDNRKVRMVVSIYKDFTERKRNEDITKYLDEASRMLLSSLDYEETLQKIAKLSVPKLADWCVVDILSPGNGMARSIATEHIDPSKVQLVHDFKSKYNFNWSDSSPALEVIHTGIPELYTEVSPELLRISSQNEHHYQLMQRLGLHSAMIVPLISRGKVFGIISFFSAESGRNFSADDLLFAKELARRASTAMDNSLLYMEAESERNKNKLALEKMEKLAELAEAANQTKSLFLANMSHEIRTPLGAILGFTEFLNDPVLPVSERSKYTNIIHRNGQLLTQIIDDILDLSKVEAGHLTIEKLEVSVFNLLSDLGAVMNLRAEEKGLQFTIDAEDSVPNFIFSDPMRLRQILINLVGNAIKFTGSGYVKIHVSTDQKENLIFEVSDTGHGILPENQSRMFEWFTQADSSTTRKFGGTGLGLALSRRLARALGGDIILEKSSEAGSIFKIHVAMNLNAATSAANLKSASADKKAKAPADKGESPYTGLRILLVDDSEDNRMLIKTILTRKGMIITTAENGQVGVDLATSQEFDIILMDMQMPVLDGFQATQELRRQGYRKPILALTAHAMKEEREKTKGAGCDAHLTKPIDVANLLSLILDFSRPESKIDMI